MHRALILLAWIPLVWQPTWGQTPSVGIKSDSDKKTQGKFTTAQSNSDQRGTKDSPLVVDMLSRPKSQEESAKEKADDEHKAFIDGWTVGSAIAVALFTGLLVIVGWRGVKVARDTLTAIQGQLAEIQSAGQQTDQMLEHANAQAQAAREQVRISELAMVASNRAYVHHSGIWWFSHPQAIGSRANQVFWRIRPKWTNRGRTPD